MDATRVDKTLVPSSRWRLLFSTEFIFDYQDGHSFEIFLLSIGIRDQRDSCESAIDDRKVFIFFSEILITPAE